MNKFFKGMDVSSLPEYFDMGAQFYNGAGLDTDAF